MIQLALVSINRNKYSETFIHRHVQELPAQIHYLTGGYFPKEVSKGWSGEVQSLIPKPLKKGLFRNRYPGPSRQDLLRKYLVDNQARCLLAEYGPSGVEMGPICEELGIPLIVHFHGYDAYRNDILAAFGDRYPAMFQQAAAIIAVSKHMRTQLIKLGAPTEKVHWIPCGPDEKLFSYNDSGKNPPHFLAVGRFAETKSPHLTLLAFHKVLQKAPEARLRYCGGGHLEQACIILANSLGIANKVDFMGVLPHEQVAQEMSKARAFVQHSVTTPENDTEGTPVSIQEAGLSGLPVISTRHAGIPDVVINGETGILVPEGNLEAMAEAMIELAEAPERASEMGKKAHLHLKENFTLQIHLDKLWKVIEPLARK